MRQKMYGKIALVVTAALWGTTFSIGKLATEAFSPSFIIALRFTVASITLVIVSMPFYKLLNRKYWSHGIWMGITLFGGYILQVGGLALDTSPGKSAFLCTSYCILVPFVHWLATKRKPELAHVFSVFICVAGIGVLSLHGGWGMSRGDLLTVLSGVPSAVNIVISSIVCKDKNPLLLTTIELSVVAILAWVVVGVTGTFPAAFPPEAVGGIVYLGLFATALCLYLQSFGLKYAEPAVGGMILSLESVFGVIFAMIIYHEKVTVRMLLGFVLIFVAIVLSQKETKDAVIVE